VYWLTGNIILCYNLLFISTFALSALGMYLLVRDLTGDSRAAFIAGLVYGFLPYRIASVPHIQVMSSQWMPLALYGLNRFVTSGSMKGLAGGVGALVMQNWSCGYYLLYFAPFVPLFLIHRMWTAGTLRSTAIWSRLIAGAIVTVVMTLPFLMPYLAAQREFGLERPLYEIVRYSASPWSYLTASENMTLWGRALRFYPRPEGETFLGILPWLLAAVALSSLLMRRRTDAESPVSSVSRVITSLLVFAVAAQLIGLIAVILFGGFEVGPVSARSPMRLLIQFSVALALLLAISQRARAETRRVLRSPVTIALASVILAVWLSLGSNSAAYNLLHDYVPGFDAVRVPARYAMIVGLFLAILAGFGAQKLLAQAPGPKPQALLVTLATLVVLESVALPIETNRAWKQNEAMPPSAVTTYANAPPVYARIKELPAGAVISEFPFGDMAWEIRYVYYAAAHMKPITNGYSGAFPPRYRQRVARLQFLDRDPAASWQSLKESGTTHVVIHRNAFADGARADAVKAWLEAYGAVEIERFADGDVLFKIKF
jgi:hypothetical protein